MGSFLATSSLPDLGVNISTMVTDATTQLGTYIGIAAAVIFVVAVVWAGIKWGTRGVKKT